MVVPLAPLVELSAITKQFPGGVIANEGVTLSLFEGEVHALVGENGAGKSTLMNVLFGVYEPDEGTISIGGRPVRHRRPADAIANGIGMVHQHFKLIPSFTVAENLLLARRDRRFRLEPRQADEEFRALAERYGFNVDPNAIVGTLPLAVQQRVEILKALYQDARIIIFDEPTTVLTPAEVDVLYEVLTGIAGERRGVILITHHLSEVFRFSQRISVLRGGHLVGSGLTAEMTRDEVAELIVGSAEKTWEPREERAATHDRSPVLQLEQVTISGTAFSTGLRDFTLEAQPGEILAVAGVEGNGQRELFEVLAGLRAPEGGRIIIGGTPYASLDRASSAGLGVRVIPEDRHAEGLILELGIAENLLLDRIGRRPFSRWGRLAVRSIHRVAQQLISRFDIRTSSSTAPAHTLSGGNQQKVVVARALSEPTLILLAHQPTRGLDIAATAAVLSNVVTAAEQGAAVIFISSSLDEVFAVGDTIAVLYRGRRAGIAARTKTTRDEVGRWMTGAQQVA
ncbi:ABC transporter ATP-binding protein [soil metagenome]